MRKEYDIVKVIGDKKERVKDSVVKEFPLKIFINGIEFSTLLCSPDQLKYLVIGHLYSEGVIKDSREIKNFKLNEFDGVVNVGLKHVDFNKRIKNRVIYSGCAYFYDYKNLKIKRIKNDLKVKKKYVLGLMEQLQLRSKLFQETGGVHASALSDKRIIFFTEDIGRHNTIDKIIGYSLVKRIKLKNKVILTTGRLSSEMVLKLAKAGIPVIVSKSAPTDMAVNLAKKLNITLIGFVRGKRFNVYNNKKNVLD